MFRQTFLRVAVPSLLAIVPLGCELKTSDADLRYLEPLEAVELASKSRGTFGISGLPTTVWLDSRTEANFAEGHVPHAINLPFDRLENEQEFVLGKPDLIYCIDTDFDDVVAKAAAKRLMELGRDKKSVYVIRGGMKAWRRAGLQVETGKGADVEKPFE